MQEYTVRVDSNGTKAWWQNDKLHRLDGPAIEYVDGPASRWVNICKSWYQNGKRHRLDGPAVECYDGAKSWYIEGEHLTEQEFLSRTQSPRKVTMQEVVEQFGENVVITKGKG